VYFFRAVNSINKWSGPRLLGVVFFDRFLYFIEEDNANLAFAGTGRRTILQVGLSICLRTQ
jgi:hypothetical protein